MQTCSNCGANVREGARFCTTCGTQLNEASSGSSPFSWGAAIEQTSTPEGGWPTTTSATDEPAQTEAAGDVTGAWNWSESPDSPSTDAVDEESGIVLDDPDREPDAGLVDPTEVDDLDAPIDGEESAPSGDKEPDLSIVEDEVSVNTEDNADASSEGQETLAAWAQSWSSDPESADSTAADDVDRETAVEAVLAGISSEEPGLETDASDTDDEDEEETLAKAERLIAELQSLVPKLARPKPANPNQQLTPKLLADELDERIDGAQWADLREVLEKARDNPHDINHLMSVSGNASRLLDLLDDRESLANRASSVAQRLRNPDSAENA